MPALYFDKGDPLLRDLERVHDAMVVDIVWARTHPHSKWMAEGSVDAYFRMIENALPQLMPSELLK